MQSIHDNKLKASLVLALLFLAASLVGQPQTGNVQLLVEQQPVANMFSKPDGNSDVVSQAILGTNVEVLETRGAWLRIRTPDAYTGWAEARNFIPPPSGETAYAIGAHTAQVTSLFANLYRETDITSHAPIMEIPFESRLELTSKEAEGGHWYEVRLPDGRTAWIQSGDVTLHAQTLNIPESIDLAKKFLGVTYTWGGRSSFGFDCSGFTQMILRSRGISMPRDADQQAAWSGAVPVERTRLQPGDLLFFGKSAQNITHTGMYIGDGRFIHDTTHDHPMVQISRLDDEPWTHLLVACRRAK